MPPIGANQLLTLFSIMNKASVFEQLLHDESDKMMISSNHHMDRAVRNASEEGFTKVMSLPASSGIFAYGANMLSEIELDLNDLIK